MKKTLIECLGNVTDYRSGNGVDHKLIDILVISILYVGPITGQNWKRCPYWVGWVTSSGNCVLCCFPHDGHTSS